MTPQTTEQKSKSAEAIMQANECGVCRHVELDGNIPEKCPVCNSPKTAYHEMKDLKTPQTVATSGETEKKHIPAISVVKKCGLIPDGCTDVNVKIGEVVHPMLPEHHIEWIDFYLDRRFISRITLSPTVMNPAASLHMKASSGKFTAIEHCNVHGTWYNETML